MPSSSTESLSGSEGEKPPAWELIIDGKPLPVGHCSKDPDAKGSNLGKGYKIHTIWSDKLLSEAWEVTALARAREPADFLEKLENESSV